MEQLNGKWCYLCFVAIILTHQKGRSKCGWTICREESDKKRFQYCLDSDGYFLYMRAVQGHSGGNKVEPSQHGNVKNPYNWIEYVCHVGSSHDCNSVIRSGPIAGGRDSKEGRQTVMFTAEDPVNEPQEDEPYYVTKPRQVPYRTRLKVHQNAIFWINLKSAQDNGLAFWQNRSVAIIFPFSVPADCLEKWYIPKLKKCCIRRLTHHRVCHQKFYPEECLASSTRRLSSTWNWCRSTFSRRGEHGTWNRLQNSRYITCRSRTRRRQSETVDEKTGACRYASSQQRCNGSHDGIRGMNVSSCAKYIPKFNVFIAWSLGQMVSFIVTLAHVGPLRNRLLQLLGRPRPLQILGGHQPIV